MLCTGPAGAAENRMVNRLNRYSDMFLSLQRQWAVQGDVRPATTTLVQLEIVAAKNCEQVLLAL